MILQVIIFVFNSVQFVVIVLSSDKNQFIAFITRLWELIPQLNIINLFLGYQLFYFIYYQGTNLIRLFVCVLKILGIIFRRKLMMILLFVCQILIFIGCWFIPVASGIYLIYTIYAYATGSTILAVNLILYSPHALLFIMLFNGVFMIISCRFLSLFN